MGVRRTAEQVWRGLLRGPLTTLTGNSNAWAGIATITTASNIASVATALVQSGDLIFFTPILATSLSTGQVCIRSIDNGNGFIFGFTDNTTRSVNIPVMWKLIKSSQSA